MAIGYRLGLGLSAPNRLDSHRLVELVATAMLHVHEEPLAAQVVTQALPTDSLRLARIEKRAIVAFLRALTDTDTSKR